MNKLRKNFTIIIMVVIIALVFMLIFCYPMMLLWNWLMPVIFGLPTITFWQMLGLQVLFSFLFKPNHINTNK